jgi:SAM-dependent methyltransferase
VSFLFGSKPTWDEYIGQLRAHWNNVPLTEGVVDSNALLRFDDDKLKRYYEEKMKVDDYDMRGWYRELYSPIFKEKNVLDVGAGLGMDTLTFASAGARVTSADIVQSNAQLVARISKLRGLAVKSLYIENLGSLEALGAFDFIYCCGSFHNAPFDVMKQEAHELLKHLPVGGRWVELAYPKERWEKEGRKPFDKWGEKTDWGAPYVEWYDIAKLRKLLEPAHFQVVLSFNFYNNDFNWFDLRRTV